MKILIVDDDELARVSLSAIARDLPGVSGVAQAADGEAAWALLEDGLRPALCCCDVAMPRLDGLGLLRRLRAHPVRAVLPVVLISAAADRDTVQAAKAGRVAGYILKPFPPAQTGTALARLLAQERLARAEAVQDTCRRLNIEAAQLVRLLQKMRSGTDQCLAGPAATDDALQRLQAAATGLGLWRCAELLQAAGEAGVAEHAPPLLLQEVGRLVDDQLRELQPEPEEHPA